MKSINRVYLSGLGAVGASYAFKLHEMDPCCLKIIADRQRIDKYSHNGIFINGKPYAFNYIEPSQSAEPADLILIAVKQHHLEQSIKDISKFVGKDTIILSLLNGIVSEEIVGKAFGMDKVLYSFCVGTDATREGTSINFSKVGTIVFGDKSNTDYSANVSAVKELFDRADIPYRIPLDMLRELWWKFMMNVGINQVSAVLKAPYGVLVRVKEAEDLIRMASREVVALSEKAGINLNESDIDDYFKILFNLSPDGKTSMLQDVEAGRKTEVEIFSGTVIELGRKYGVQTPVNDILYKMIRTLEQTY
ncbi:MAG: ketopantoate reductase family protein [Clostridia bacterium]|nr:ketopantoate reductase family protein [Clostridia bacterium]